MCQETAEAIVYLAGCAIGGITPDRKRLGQVNFKEVYSISVGQSLQALIFVALQDAYSGAFPDNGLFLRWRDRYEAATMRNKMLNEEMEQVLAFLENDGIWHTPLKGAVLQAFYPQPEMRQMTDRDILFDETQRQKVKKWFTTRGYKADFYDAGGVVTVYTKRPFYCFEMHTSIFGYNPDTNWYEYYEGVKQRFIPDKGKKHAYHFSDEDFYIHLIIHGCKHYFNEGNGLRLLIDIYVYLKAKDTELDWQYIHRELSTLAAADFEVKARKLSQRLFVHPQEFALASLTVDEAAFLNTFMENGVYGNIANLIRNKISSPTLGEKARYVWQRMFPEAKFFKYNYPFFWYHRWLLPVGYVYRIVHRLRVSRNKLKREVTAIWRL